ncbi:hypothetical protein [Candidatus Lokiarchaeum ossiferum]|uniref:hypothetical protein n=1 Tax=Candidatus Lokiarchaeum ossiferum TaxID=2951803 RepID=UPI00352FA147
MKLFKKKSHSIDTGEVEKYNVNNGLDENASFRPSHFNKTDVNNASHRFAQMKCNPIAFKHTYGIAQKLLGKRPLPFIYVAKDHMKSENVTPLANLDYIHGLWTDDSMFDHLINIFAEGLGVNSSFIFQMDDGTYKVFNTSHVNGENYWRDPKTRELKAIQVDWKGSSGGQAYGSGIPLNEIKLVGVFGQTAVKCTPIPNVQNVFGLSSLLPIWDMITYKMKNKYYNMVINKKGGAASRLLVIPDNVKSNDYKRFEKEAKKGVESELITIKYPFALANNRDPSKVVQWTENQVGQTNYVEFDNILSNDSPIPASFMDGPESGALGGQAPVIDDNEIDEIVSHYFSMIEQTIKDINETFYGIEPNYSVIPFLQPKDEETQINEGETGEGPEQELEQESEEKPIQTKTHSMKFHSIAGSNNQWIYEGNLWEEGWYQYDTGHEYLPADEIKAFIDDPMSVKDGYVSMEHIGEDVPKHLSIAKYETYGYEIVDGKLRDKTRVTFSFDPQIEEMDVSPVYNSKDIFQDNKTIQTKIDLRNVAVTSAPRSSLTGKSTKIRRSTQ